MPHGATTISRVRIIQLPRGQENLQQYAETLCVLTKPNMPPHQERRSTNPNQWMTQYQLVNPSFKGQEAHPCWKLTKRRGQRLNNCREWFSHANKKLPFQSHKWVFQNRNLPDHTDWGDSEEFCVTLSMVKIDSQGHRNGIRVSCLQSLQCLLQ